MQQETAPIEKRDLAEKLLAWWKINGRDFPWRHTRNPYRILVSELLLHRTRADQVVPTYTEFVEEFPTVQDLAKAEQSEITKILKRLGLFWRIKLVKQLAQQIIDDHRGKVPSEMSKLESLPGVSHYIAGAVCSFAFNKPAALLDTNTVRILGRLFDVEVTDSSRRSRRFVQLYESVLDKRRAREFNYAMLDLGALLCSPSSPKCIDCPLGTVCDYGQNKGVVAS